MNGFGQTADKKKSSNYMKTGSYSKSIFEALQGATGTSIFEMLREPHSTNSIFEEIRTARSPKYAKKGSKESILQVDWKNRK